MLPVEGGLAVGIVHPGDQLIRIDDHDVRNWTPQEVQTRLRIKQDEPLLLVVLRRGVETVLVLPAKAKREALVQRYVKANHIGYIRLKSFLSEGLCEELEKDIVGLEEQGIRAW